MTAFNYQPMFSLGEDDTTFRQLTDEHVSTSTFEGQKVLKVAPQGLALLAEQRVCAMCHISIDPRIWPSSGRYPGRPRKFSQ
jgi:fumarate hydratase, class I